MTTEFFGQLLEFSARVFRAWGLPSVCRWKSQLDSGSPRGAILHYTAGHSLKRTVRYFMDHKFEAKASAHAVVGVKWSDELVNLAKDLPLMPVLPVPIVLCVPLTKASWHATWVNGLCYGIEQVNKGLLLVGERAVGGRPLWMCERLWDPYPVAQIEAVIMLLRALREVFPGLRRNWVLGHEHVQSERTPGSSYKDKRDPGPHYPLEAIRQAVFELEATPLDQLPGLAHFRTDRFYGRTRRDGLVLTGAQSDADAVWEAFPARLEAWPQDEPARTELAKTALAVLGYDVTSNPEETFFIFRRMEGLPLNEDGITSDFQEHIRARVLDRFF